MAPGASFRRSRYRAGLACPSGQLVFSNGTPAVGVITDLLIAKDRGRLEFEFEVEGRRVRSWIPIHKTKSVLSLSPGDRVDLLFDESKPTRAIIKGLYTI